MIDSVARFLETRGMLEDALNVAEGLEKLSASAWENGKNNVAFVSLFLLGKVEEFIELLIER